MSRLRTFALAGALALPLAFGGFFLAERRERDGAKVFDQVLSLVQDRYVDSLPSAALYERAAKGLVKQLHDPYSELFSPAESRAFSRQANGRYGGAGMQIEQQDGDIVVVRVFPHTPAESAGIFEGDRIVRIDSASTRGWSSQHVSDVMIGEVGTKVTVRFARPGVTAPLTHEFTRAEVHIPAVPYAIMLEHGIGYIPLQQFNQTASEELRAATDQLLKSGAKSFIIDLRGDPGGILGEALAVASLYLKAGAPIASVRTRSPRPQSFQSNGNEHLTSAPLVILVDGYSASASEIVAGALQDHDRALLVGTRSFGKGLVQSVVPLEDQWELKLTTGRWYTPSGRSIQRDRPHPDPDDPDADPAATDTTPKDTSLKSRPTVRSEGGRLLYAGGGITPDVIVLPDTLSTAEQEFSKLLAPRFSSVRAALYDIALQEKSRVKPQFSVAPAWRDAFFQRLGKDSLRVDRAEFDAVTPLVDRLIGTQVARVAFGDSAAFRRNIGTDAQLVRAISLLARSHTQSELFSLAQANSTERR